MRTKALFVAAATGLAALTTSMAQVYSVNVVGYINVDVPAGFAMVANQLDNGNGNLATDILAGQLANGDTIYKFNSASGSYDILSLVFGNFTGATSMTLNPGEGVFIKTAAAKTITFVGEVLEGAQDVSIPAGFSIFSAVAPVTTDLSATEVAWPVENGDTYYQWNSATQAYSITSVVFGGWQPSPVVLGVGEAAWVKKTSAKTWTRDFSVPRG